MTYIHRGKVVEKKPFSLTDALATLWVLALLFITTLISINPLGEQVEAFRRSRQPGAPAWNPRGQLPSFFGGGGSSGSGGGRPTGSGPRGNIQSFSNIVPGGCGSCCGGGGCS